MTQASALKLQKYDLGTFKVESGELIVSDPCYKVGTWCAGSLKAVNGEWKASSYGADIHWAGERYIRRVTSLIVESSKDNSESMEWERTKIHAGVDSGQMSIYDIKFYRDDAEAEGRDISSWTYGKKPKGKGETFYAAACCLTLGDYVRDESGDRQRGFTPGGILPHGVVSSSGEGDGGYAVYVKKNSKGLIIAVKVNFLEDMGDEEDEDA